MIKTLCPGGGGGGGHSGTKWLPSAKRLCGAEVVKSSGSELI